MNFIEWLKEQELAEMSIGKFSLQGDWGPKAPKWGYNRQDIGILTNQKAVDKIHRKWQGAKQTFDFYFARSRQAYSTRYTLKSNGVSPEWVKENIGLDIQPDPDSITVIFTNNQSVEKIPMNAWDIAHRTGHAIQGLDNWQNYVSKNTRQWFTQALKAIYNLDISTLSNQAKDTILVKMAEIVGTMRSARNKNIVSFGEFTCELLAQHLTTGGIHFNPMPKFFITRNRMAWGRPAPEGRRAKPEELADWNEGLNTLANTLGYYLDEVLNSCEGKIFIM